MGCNSVATWCATSPEATDPHGHNPGWAELENAYAELEAQRDSLQLEVGWVRGPESPSFENTL